MRLVFAGTPEVAVPALDALLASRHEVVAVVTRPDAPAGRGRRAARSPIATCADDAGRPGADARRSATPTSSSGSPSSRPTAARSWRTARSFRRRRSTSRRTAGSTCTSRCCPPGAGPRRCSTRSCTATTSPAPRTFRLEEGLDTGPVFGVVTEPIAADGHQRRPAGPARRSGAGLLVATLDGIEAGTLQPVPQPPRASACAPKITVEDARVDWTAPAIAVDRRIRACTPAPGAWTTFRGERLRLGPVRPAADDATGRPGRAARRASRRPRRHRDDRGRAGRGPAAGQAADARGRLGSRRAHRRRRAPGVRPVTRRPGATPGRTRGGRRRRRAHPDPARQAAYDASGRSRSGTPTPTWCCPACCASAGSCRRDAAFATELAYGTLRFRGHVRRGASGGCRPAARRRRPAGPRRASPGRPPAAADPRARPRGGVRHASSWPGPSSAKAGPGSSTPCCAGSRLAHSTAGWPSSRHRRTPTRSGTSP